MIGAIIGDIVGSVYEFNNIKTKVFPLFLPDCKFTDDTVMSIAIFKAVQDSLKEFKKLATKDNHPFPKYAHLAKHATVRMQEYGKLYINAGYAQMFKEWIFSDNPRPYNSLGNGSAMRISALPYFAKNLDELLFMTEQVTAVTHNHPEAIDGAKATTTSIWMALHGKSKDEIKQHIENKFGYNLNYDYEELRKTYTYHVDCKNTVPQAIFCFLISTDFEDAIRTGISIGGDSDTLCAITGSIAAAYYGVPKEIETQATKFLDKRLLKDYKKFIKLSKGE